MSNKLVLLSFAAVLIFATVARAAAPSDIDIEILINEDKITDWTVSAQYKENITRSDFYVLARRITGLEVIANNSYLDCNIVKMDIGTDILCENINADRIIYKFHGHDMISNFEELRIFNQRFLITELVNKISITVKLPLGTVLVEKSKISGTGLQPFEPEWGSEGSDGRRIYVIWEQSNPKLGETVSISLIYEQIFGGTQYAIFIIPLVAASAIVLIYFFKKRSVKDILPILTSNERKVVEILLREKKGVDQRSIVKETDYSKSKISRILRDLEHRGLVERSRKGRTNIVKLKGK